MCGSVYICVELIDPKSFQKALVLVDEMNTVSFTLLWWHRLFWNDVLVKNTAGIKLMSSFAMVNTWIPSFSWEGAKFLMELQGDSDGATQTNRPIQFMHGGVVHMASSWVALSTFVFSSHLVRHPILSYNHYWCLVRSQGSSNTLWLFNMQHTPTVFFFVFF